MRFVAETAFFLCIHAHTLALRLGDCCRRLGDNHDAWEKFTLCLKAARDAGESGTGFIRKCKQRLRSLTAIGHHAPSESAAAPPTRRLPPASSGKSVNRQKSSVIIQNAASSSGSDEVGANGSCGSSSASESLSDEESESGSSMDSTFDKAERERKAATPCRNWANFGSCQHGSGCHFSHQRAAASAAAQTPTDAPRPPCRNWAVGHCKFGRLCHFSHDVSLKK
jgi:hypothetical protein